MLKIILIQFVLISLFCQNSKSDKLLHSKKLINAEKYSEAKDILLDLVDEDDELHEAFFLLGNIYTNEKDYDEAIDHYEEAIDLDEDNVDYLVNYGKTLYLSGPKTSVLALPFLASKIKKTFLYAMELDSHRLDIHLSLGMFHSSLPSILGGDLEEAAKAVNYLLPRKEIDARRIQFKIYKKNKQYDLAEIELQRLENLGFDISQYYNFFNRYGYSLLEKKNYNLAIVKFKEQIRLAPDQANPYDSLAEAYLTVKNYKLALKYYEKAWEIDAEMISEESVERITEIDESFKDDIEALFAKMK